MEQAHARMFRIPLGRYNRFKAICATRNNTVTSEINQLIIAYLQRAGFGPDGQPLEDDTAPDAGARRPTRRHGNP